MGMIMMPIADDIYDDPTYSPTSGDQLSFYDDGGDDGLLPPPPLRRFYDDDDQSQHSGSSVPLHRDRGEYFQSSRTAAVRYEERDYDRAYQHYSSSVPTRHQHHSGQPYLSDREMEHAEWAAASSLVVAAETASMTGYSREQYPTAREFPSARPTLEDRERELDMINQKNAAGAGAGAGAARLGYGRRPPATAPGTVAHLRRRFSDQSVSDIPSGMVSPTQGARPRGMSGSGPTLLQQQQQQQREEALRRDSRYPPRASTPQSRLVAASVYRQERGMGVGVGKLPPTSGGTASGRYSSAGGGVGPLSDYEDGGSGRVSVLVGDPRARRR
ncbi:hypothetical protein BGZ98_005207 [Dissophora globulifera]|nr:hypothetical protein BGZ98_005207 [Dissophora globulifera]